MGFETIGNIDNVPSVYAIWNRAKYKFYIGSCKNLIKRAAEHKTLLTNNKHHVKAMQDDFNNGDDLALICLTKVSNEFDLRHYEMEALKLFSSKFQVYNKQKIYSDSTIESLHIQVAFNDFECAVDYGDSLRLLKGA